MLVFFVQLEQLYKDAHQKIRADPTAQKKPAREDVKVKRSVASLAGLGGVVIARALFCRWNRVKMSRQQRADRVRQKKAAFMKTLRAED